MMTSRPGPLNPAQARHGLLELDATDVQHFCSLREVAVAQAQAARTAASGGFAKGTTGEFLEPAICCSRHGAVTVSTVAG